MNISGKKESLMPKVSVIIPFYSHADWLAEAIESVKQQDYKDYEIIVINDGSEESLDTLLKTYGDSIVYRYKNNGGAATARNLGMELASGEYIAFLDSDDLWLPNKLSIQVNYMENTEAVWSYCGYETFGDANKKIYCMTKKRGGEIQRYSSHFIATPTVMVRTDFLREHVECRFHPGLKFGEDSYMWFAINSTKPILALPEVLVKVRMRGTNASRCARIQLKARGNLWGLRKQNHELLLDNFEVSKLFSFASNLCIFGDRMVQSFSKFIKSDDALEIISRILFVSPWALFKLDRIINKKT